MENLAPVHQVSLEFEHRETHTVIGGFWTIEKLEKFFDDTREVVAPLLEERLPIYAFVDLTGFLAQDRETTAALRDHLLLSQSVGLKRVAIGGASALVRTQYRRLSQGLEVEFFEEKTEALKWLRADR